MPMKLKSGTNPYRCPDNLYRMIVLANPSTTPPMLRAVAALGPRRVEWVGPGPTGRVPPDFTAWALDGVRARLPELLKAAGLPSSSAFEWNQSRDTRRRLVA